ncbi:hypothetical protein FHT83_003243 [Rhizobium sp. BK284]|nr:hypothetical protein [Rhizobium sp. BK289]MBB3415583.1 hypothetical protein [Rhizobium sp. BK284]
MALRLVAGVRMEKATLSGRGLFDSESMSGVIQDFSSHSCSTALWNFQMRFGPAITLR